jgi:hypothetical protein
LSRQKDIQRLHGRNFGTQFLMRDWRWWLGRVLATCPRHVKYRKSLSVTM